eukprot:TRINITY_DN634_c0_g1_i1.p1 TRINITY_DN634_c0_g1~~TRINITY_DN634_c0_g1_i1.p1  ORF type:complete len:253 (-),score=39.33 TRINITY_DN634_c0_g1_i1:32-790(-)
MSRQLVRNKGWIVALTEHRGMGSSSERPNKNSDWGYYKLISVEMPAYLQTVVSFYPENKIYLLGHSLGGQLNTLFLSHLLLTANRELYDRISGSIQVGSPNLYYRIYSFRILIYSFLMMIYIFLFGYYDGKLFGFGGVQPKMMMYDWMSIVHHGKWTINGSSHDLDGGLKNIDKRMLFITLGKDYYAPPRTVQGFMEKCRPENSSLLLLNKEDLGPEFVNYTPKLLHFRWVKNPTKLADYIEAWMHQEDNES